MSGPESQISSLSAEAEKSVQQSISQFPDTFLILPGIQRLLVPGRHVTERCLDPLLLRKADPGNHLILPLDPPKVHLAARTDRRWYRTPRRWWVYREVYRRGVHGGVHRGVHQPGQKLRKRLPWAPSPGIS